MLTINYGWAIFEVAEQDYKMWWDGNFLSIQDLPKIEWKVFEYNQLEWEKFWKCMCTLYAWFSMFSFNNVIKIWVKERETMCNTRYNLPDFDPKVGWYLKDWLKVVIDFHKNGVLYRIHKNEALELLEKGYIVNFGIYIGDDLKLASNDGILNNREIETIKDKKYGHSTCIYKSDSGYWVDSYVWVKTHNITKIDNIDEFIKKWFIFDWAYVIIPNKVIREKIYKIIWEKWYKESLKLYDEISDTMYPREKQIFQYCLQMKFIWKLNTPKLKELVF